ncbi:unnamed protein product [Urochloa humidicola]
MKQRIRSRGSSFYNARGRGEAGDGDDALRSLLGAGRKLHLLTRTTGPPRPRPRKAGGASALRTSSRFPFPVGIRAAGLAPLQLLCRLGAAACRAAAPHQLHSTRPDGAAPPPRAGPRPTAGLGVPGRGPAAPGTGLTGRGSATLTCWSRRSPPPAAAARELIIVALAQHELDAACCVLLFFVCPGLLVAVSSFIWHARARSCRAS